MSSKLAIAKDTGAFLASTLVIQVLSLVLAVFIRKVLGPESMGVWTFLGVLQTYIAYTNLGMVNAVSREIPVLRGAGAPPAEIERVRDTGFTYITAVSLFTAGMLLAGAFAWRSRLPEPVFYGLLMLAVLTIIERTNNYLVQILYADKEFVLTSRFRIWSAVANAGLVLALVGRFGLYGMYVASVLSFAFNWAYLNLKSKIRFHLRWDKAETAKLMRFGIPLFALTFLWSFFNSLDKVVVGAMLGMTELGVYSIAVMAASYVFMLPNVFQIVLLPRTLERFGDASDVRGRWTYAVLPGRLMVGYFSLFIALFWIAAPLLCSVFLEEYLAGIPALKAALFGACFASLAQQMSHVLLGYKRHLWMLPVMALMAAGIWGAGAWVAAHGGRIEHVAVIMALFQLVGYAVSFMFAFYAVLGPRRAASELLLNLAPLAFCAGTLIFFDAIWPGVSMAGVFVKTVFYGVLWLGVFGILEKRMGLMGMLKDTFKAWRREEALS